MEHFYISMNTISLYHLFVLNYYRQGTREQTQYYSSITIPISSQMEVKLFTLALRGILFFVCLVRSLSSISSLLFLSFSEKKIKETELSSLLLYFQSPPSISSWHFVFQEPLYSPTTSFISKLMKNQLLWKFGGQ